MKEGERMTTKMMIFINDCPLPCLSCDKVYLGCIDKNLYEWCCDEKECPYKKEEAEGGIV